MKTEYIMPFDVGRYLTNTMGLTSSEHGAYLLLILDYWSNGGPIKSDDKYLKMVSRCPDHEWARTKGVLEQYFISSNGLWRHEFLDKEIAKSIARKKQQLEASAKGVEARREMGQIQPLATPLAQSSGAPPGQVAMRITREKELDRVEKRIAEIRQQGTTTAQGTTYSVAQKAELRTLKDRKEELKKALGFVA